MSALGLNCGVIICAYMTYYSFHFGVIAQAAFLGLWLVHGNSSIAIKWTTVVACSVFLRIEAAQYASLGVPRAIGQIGLAFLGTAILSFALSTLFMLISKYRFSFHLRDMLLATFGVGALVTMWGNPILQAFSPSFLWGVNFSALLNVLATCIISSAVCLPFITGNSLMRVVSVIIATASMVLCPLLRPTFDAWHLDQPHLYIDASFHWHSTITIMLLVNLCGVYAFGSIRSNATFHQYDRSVLESTLPC